jgi:hypothetical protein
MRESGVRCLLVYCADYRCSYSIAISGDAWPDDVRLFDIGARYVCRGCGKRGADVRPDFNWNRQLRELKGYRQDSQAPLRLRACHQPPIGIVDLSAPADRAATSAQRIRLHLLIPQ